jgi:hypothetical protein
MPGHIEMTPTLDSDDAAKSTMKAEDISGLFEGTAAKRV